METKNDTVEEKVGFNGKGFGNNDHSAAWENIASKSLETVLHTPYKNRSFEVLREKLVSSMISLEKEKEEAAEALSKYSAEVARYENERLYNFLSGIWFFGSKIKRKLDKKNGNALERVVDEHDEKIKIVEPYLGKWMYDYDQLTEDIKKLLEVKSHAVEKKEANEGLEKKYLNEFLDVTQKYAALDERDKHGDKGRMLEYKMLDADNNHRQAVIDLGNYNDTIVNATDFYWAFLAQRQAIGQTITAVLKRCLEGKMKNELVRKLQSNITEMEEGFQIFADSLDKQKELSVIFNKMLVAYSETNKLFVKAAKKHSYRFVDPVQMMEVQRNNMEGSYELKKMMQQSQETANNICYGSKDGRGAENIVHKN